MAWYPVEQRQFWGSSVTDVPVWIQSQSLNMTNKALWCIMNVLLTVLWCNACLCLAALVLPPTLKVNPDVLVEIKRYQSQNGDDRSIRPAKGIGCSIVTHMVARLSRSLGVWIKDRHAFQYWTVSQPICSRARRLRHSMLHTTDVILFVHWCKDKQAMGHCRNCRIMT